MPGFDNRSSRRSVLPQPTTTRRRRVTRFAFPLMAVAGYLAMAVGLVLVGLAPGAFASAPALSVTAAIPDKGSGATSVVPSLNEPMGLGPAMVAVLRPADGSAPDDSETSGPVQGLVSPLEGQIGTGGTVIVAGIPYVAIGVVLIVGAVSVMAVVARRHEEGCSN